MRALIFGVLLCSTYLGLNGQSILVPKVKLLYPKGSNPFTSGGPGYPKNIYSTSTPPWGDERFYWDLSRNPKTKNYFFQQLPSNTPDGRIGGGFDAFLEEDLIKLYSVEEIHQALAKLKEELIQHDNTVRADIQKYIINAVNGLSIPSDLEERVQKKLQKYIQEEIKAAIENQRSILKAELLSDEKFLQQLYEQMRKKGKIK